MSETNRCEGPARAPVYYEDEPSEPLGAQCKDASSDASKLATQTNDDTMLRDYLHTRAVDRPIEDDVIGNMIPGAIVGGAAAGIARGAVTSSLGAMAAAAGSTTAKDVAKGVAKQAAVDSVKRSVDVRTLEPTEPKPEPPPPVGRDRSPYAPDNAPLRIPEAPIVICG